jgi:hypothetical protein
MKNMAFWVVTLCSLQRRFGLTYTRHLQGQIIKKERNQR